jgi:hypothetical protein
MSRSSITVSASRGMPCRPERRGEFALVHHAVADEVGVLHVVDDERAEVAGIGQRAAHHLALVTERAPSVNATAPASAQPDLGHLAGLQALGERRGRAHVHDRLLARAAEHEID